MNWAEWLAVLIIGAPIVVLLLVATQDARKPRDRGSE